MNLSDICLTVGVIALFLSWLMMSGGNQPYPPRDEKGRPMKACFGRGTPFRWVRQSDDE